MPTGSLTRRSAIATIALLSLLLSASQMRADSGAELLMFEEPGCPWCVRWHAEVGPGYPLSPEGRIAPLRRVDLRQGVPSRIELVKPVRATPTFVLVQHGREVDRITGYPGADFFWGLLDQMIGKLDRKKSNPITGPDNI